MLAKAKRTRNGGGKRRRCINSLNKWFLVPFHKITFTLRGRKPGTYKIR